MKKFVHIFLITVLVLAVSVPAFAAPSYGSEWDDYYGVAPVEYSDVPSSHWAYNAVMQVYQKNWFRGYPDGTFRPDDSITRAEALKVFVMFLGLDYQSVDLSDLTYSDVPASEWYAPYVEAGKDLFPVHTTIQGKTPFNPNMPVTREDTIYALVKALGCDVNVKYPDQSVLNMFKDANSISGSIKPIFSIALTEELVSGFPDRTIRAQAALTRAEFATLLLRGTEHGFHGNYVAKISSVSVSPSNSVEMSIGETITLSARATYTDGTNKAYEDLSPYDANGNGVISLRGTKITAIKEGTAVIKYNDSYLKKESLTIVVTKPTDAPVIKIYDCPDSTESEYAEITGTVTDKTDTGIDLRCNTKDVRLNGENFTYNARLNVGKNTFEFVAVNGYGNKSSRTIVIYRDEPEPTTVEVENVVGKTESGAKSILEALGLKIKVETVWDDNVSQGTVVEQSVDAGEEVQIGSIITITVSGGKNDWVDWTESLPGYVNSSDYVIEEQTQYKYRKQETSTSTSPSKSGWTLIDESHSWGGWSSWSTSYVSSSSTREVESKSVADPVKTKTQWHYTRYYGRGASGSYVSWPWQGTYSKTYQESGWRDAPMENRGRADNVDATVYKDTSDPISVWWWNETTRTVNLPTTYHTEYRYRDKTSTYYFTRWSDWSDWDSRAVSSGDGVEVETRTVYRYKFK